jgi:predicted permease
MWRLSRLFEWWGGRSRDQELSDELSAHLECAEADFVARGLAPDEARRAARLALGGSDQIKEAVRDTRRLWLDIVWRDTRYAARQLCRTPGFTAVALLSLAVGTGVTIAVFAFGSTVLFKPLDVPDPDGLVRVTGLGGGTVRALSTFSEAHIPAQDFFHYRDENQSFASLAAQFVGGPMRVRVDGPARMIPVQWVSGNYFETLGVRPQLGHTFTSSDARAPAIEAVVLSDVGWRRFFDADPGIVGRTAFVNGHPATIVGVLPPSFTGTFTPLVPQAYAPILESPSTTYPVDLIGRLGPEVTATMAAADLRRIASQLTGRDHQMRWIETFQGSGLQPAVRRGATLVSALFIVIVGVVLLIACDNIAILLLTRAMRRRHEIAVRLALGASRFRLFVQLMTESALLCAVGSLAGISLAHVIARYLTQFYMPVPMPFALRYALDWRVVVFAVALSCMATTLCGMAPARQALKVDLMTALRSSGLLEPSRLRSNLIVTQVTLTTMLLILGVVLTRSLWAPLAPGGGFVTRDVLMTTVGLDGYAPQRRPEALEAIIATLQQLPGITSVTAADSVPLSNNRPIDPARMRANNHVDQVYANSVAPSLFQTLGIPLVAGRDFTRGDNRTAPLVGIANETLAGRFWPGESALGKRLERADGTMIEIIGVARDAKYESADEPPRAFLYRPMAQSDVIAPTLLLKASGSSAGVFSLIRIRIAEVDPDLAPFNLMTLDDRLSLGRLLNRAGAAVASGLGVLAVMLSIMGIYGTLTFIVEQRRREIGVRLALGSTGRSVIWLMTRHGMEWAIIGLAIGTTAAIALTLLLRALVRGVTVADPLAFVVTPVALAVVACLACFLPARRAARLDPLVALREE